MVEFSEPMDQRSVEEGYQVMMGNDPVAGEHSWNDEGTTMHFRSSGQFPSNTEMEVRWGGGMRSRGGMGMMSPGGRRMNPFSFRFMMYQGPSSFSSNGERIYYTATSESGEPISFTMGTGFDKDAMPGYGMSGDMGSGMGSGMGGGMMGGRSGLISDNLNGDMPVSPQYAVSTAQDYLDANMPGMEADEHAEPFYGYYTLHILRDGEAIGMLSVNGFSGQVFLHTWHGEFIEMSEH